MRGVHVLRVCALFVFFCCFFWGVDADEDEREKRSAQYIIMCSLYFTAHYLVTLTVCLPSILYVYLVYSCSSRVVCLPCL